MGEGALDILQIRKLRPPWKRNHMPKVLTVYCPLSLLCCFLGILWPNALIRMESLETGSFLDYLCVCKDSIHSFFLNEVSHYSLEIWTVQEMGVNVCLLYTTSESLQLMEKENMVAICCF